MKITGKHTTYLFLWMTQVKISVPLENLEPGMVLAEPVLNRWGQILLIKGGTISSRHLAVLKTWGIQMVVIQQGEDPIKAPLVDQDLQNRALARIKKRLFWQPQSPIEEEIINLAVQQVIQRSLQGSSLGSDEGLNNPGPPHLPGR